MSDSARATLADALRRLFDASGTTFGKLAAFGKNLDPAVNFGPGKVSRWMDKKDPGVPREWDELAILVEYLLQRVPEDRRKGRTEHLAWFRKQHAMAGAELARSVGGRPRGRSMTKARPKPRPARVASGDIVDAPPRPPGFVPRGELQRVVASIVSDDVDVSGSRADVRPVGLHGQGGVGKSVLAAEAVRDDDVRRRFPDGVVWISLGEDADLLAAQLKLLDRLGSPDTSPRTPGEAAARLRRVLADRRVLLVVDDVWSASDAEALQVAGAGGKVLYTCRDSAILTTVNAVVHRLGTLSLPTAKKLVAAVVGVDVRDLPVSVDHVCAKLGAVALAIALVAAPARDGMPWEQIADDLENGSRGYDDHPAANAFKAMQVAVGRLPVPLTHTLLSLAVFPSDTRIPIGVICRFWSHVFGKDEAESRRDLDRLARANLMQLDRSVDVVAFHDLQHDYLALHASPLAELHVSLLEAYEPMLPPASPPGWWRLPANEPYLGDHLVHHLRGSGDRITLAATVTDPAYLVGRIALSGPHQAEADLATAAAVLEADQVVTWWRGWIRRHAHWLSHQGADGGHGVVATAYAWLRADSERLSHGIDAERLTPLLSKPYLQARWGLASPRTALTRVLTGHTGEVRDVTWAPDSALLATAGDDGTVRVWEPSSGRLLFTLHGDAQRVPKLAWSPDGVFLAAGCSDGTVRVWNMTTREVVSVLTGHAGRVDALEWSPGAHRIASAGEDGTARIWEPRSGSMSAVLPLSKRRRKAAPWSWSRRVAWSPDGQRLAVTTPDHTALIWDPSTGEALRLTARFGPTTVAWSPDGTRVAACTDTKSRVFDARSGQQIMTLAAGKNLHSVTSTVWSPDGSRLATSGGGRVVVWDVASGRALASRVHRSSVDDLAWSPDGRRLAYCHAHEAAVWDPDRGDIAAIDGHTRWINALAWSPDSTRLATAGWDGTTRVWDPAADQRGAPPTTDTSGPHRAVAWSPDTRRLAVTSYDGHVQIWNGTTGQREVTLKAQSSRRVIYVTAWHPGSARLATTSVDGSVRIRDADTG